MIICILCSFFHILVSVSFKLCKIIRQNGKKNWGCVDCSVQRKASTEKMECETRMEEWTLENWAIEQTESLVAFFPEQLHSRM